MAASRASRAKVNVGVKGWTWGQECWFPSLRHLEQSLQTQVPPSKMGALITSLNDKPASEDRSVFVNQHPIISFFHSICPTIGTVPSPGTGSDAGKASATP